MIRTPGQRMLKVGIRYPIPLWPLPIVEFPFHLWTITLSMVASSIVIPIISLSTLPIQSMSLTFLHPSPNGNSLVRPGITLALGESFGLIIQLSLPFPREVRSTPIAPTLLLSRNYLNTFKRRSLKYLTAIGTALSFIKPSLLLSSTATKQYAGSLPITLIDSFRSVLSHPFSRPSATTKQEFLRYLTTLLVVLPQPLNLHSRLLRAKPHPIATTTSKKTAANPYIAYSKRRPAAPDRERDFPPMPISTAAPAKAPPPISAAKSRLPAASMATPPIPPPQSYTSEEVTAPTVATPTVLPETAAPSHLPSASSAPPPPPRRTDIEMTSPLDSGAAVPVSPEAATPAPTMEVDAGDPASRQRWRGIRSHSGASRFRHCVLLCTLLLHDPQGLVSNDQKSLGLLSFSCSPKPFALSLLCSPASGI